MADSELQDVVVHNSNEPLINSVPVSKLAAMIAEASDAMFLDNLQLFYDSLNLPSSEYSRIRLQYTLGMENCYGLVARILEDWVKNTGSFAVVGKLFEIIQSIGCIALRENLQRKFTPEMKVVLGVNSSQNMGNGSKIPNKLPMYFQIHSNNKHFTGREVESQTLFCQYKAFRDSTDGVGIALITGPEGVGKSSLAAQFCHTVRSTFSHSCLWLQVDTPSSTMESLHQIGEELEIEKSVDMPDSDRANNIIRSVHTKHGGIPLVLVFDNLRADNEIVKRLLISLNELSFPRVFIIVTSTYGPLSGFIYNEIHLQGFNLVEIEEYMSAVGLKGLTQSDSETIVSCMGGSPLILSLISHYVKFRQNSGTCTVNRLLTDLNLHNSGNNSNQQIAPLQLLSNVIAQILGLLNVDKELQELVLLILKICTIVLPSAKIQLDYLRDVYNCLLLQAGKESGKQNTNPDRFLEATLFLKSFNLLQIETNVLLPEIYSGEDSYETRFVEIHPMISTVVQQCVKDFGMTGEKKQLVSHLTTGFGKLSDETQKYCARVQSNVLQNIVEYKEQSFYSDLKRAMKLTDNPKDLFIPYIQWITIAASYGLFFCVTMAVGIIMQVIFPGPKFTNFEEGARIVLYVWLAWYSCICLAVTYIGVHILQNSTKTIKKYFIGSAARKRLLLDQVAGVLAFGYIVLMALVIVVGGSLMYTVVGSSGAYFTTILLWIVNCSVIRVVKKNNKSKRNKRGLKRN